MLSAKNNLLQAIYYRNPDHVPYAREGAHRLVDHLGRKPPREGQDAWGVRWAPLPESYRPGAGEPAESYPAAHPAEAAEELLSRPFPDPAEPILFAGLLDGVNKREALVIGQHPAGLLDRFVTLLGMPQAMLALVREAEASQAVLEGIAGYHVGIARGYLAVGVEAGWLADDYAGNSGPYVRPALWRKLILPGLARVIAVYREAGLPVFFHTCGRAEAFVTDLLDAGVTVFNLQSDVCDLASLKTRYGQRIAFFGGVASALMLEGQPEDVRNAVLVAIDTLGGDGGLILAPDQPLAFPPENEAALVEAARCYGQYPLYLRGA
jgi:uroporphyrinogen decarboxylase